MASRWVITAAHVARGVMRRLLAPSLHPRGRDYAVKAVFIHPAWTDLGDHDIALVQLAMPVHGIAPVARRFFVRSAETSTPTAVV